MVVPSNWSAVWDEVAAANVMTSEVQKGSESTQWLLVGLLSRKAISVIIEAKWMGVMHSFQLEMALDMSVLDSIPKSV